MKAGHYTKETILGMGLRENKLPDFQVGDAVAVSLRIKEGNKERIQVFEGDVIGIHNKGISSTFTVRKIGPNAVAVEKILPYNSPKVESLKVVRRSKVRRAKLYYMRDRIGKAARVK
jgi:large subunit ribosomal protein L19